MSRSLRRKARRLSSRAAFEVNPLAELVADVIEATGILAPDKIAFVRDRARTGSFAQALVEEGLAKGESIARSFALRHNLTVVDIVTTGVSPEAAEADPPPRPRARLRDPVCDRRREAPASRSRTRRTCTRSTSFGSLPSTSSRSQSRPERTSKSRSGGSRAPRRRSAPARCSRKSEEFEEVAEDEDDLEADDGISDAPLVRLVNSLIFQAAEDGASDMHFEPQKDGIVVRFRTDGVLHEVQRIPKRMTAGVTTRLKVLAKLDIAERRKPQDGRISLNARTAGRMLDIRVATLPTVDGEKIAMRLLDKSKKAPTLEELGLPTTCGRAWRRSSTSPTGALLVTGPTGSGKSTTLYAALTEINRPEINIVTVEDPVEYRLAGVNQIQINIKAGLTFAVGAALDPPLRSRCRDGRRDSRRRDGQDLDRGRAHGPLRALDAAYERRAWRDHAPERDGRRAVPDRLRGLGRARPAARPKALPALLRDVQPLDRRAASQPRLAGGVAASDGAAFYRKKGCPRCGQTGYKGRIGIYQLLVMTEEIESLAVMRASREELEAKAMEQGMRTLWDDGLAKVAAGVTSLEELGRVLV